MNKIYVDENNQALIICPKCGFERNADAKSLRTSTNIVNIKCKCTETFQVALESRKYHRKEVRLSGEFIVQKSNERAAVIIRELSMTGIRFESMRTHHISTGDILGMKFNLDNPMRTEIRKITKVIWIQDHLVGANFSETELHSKDLGFYLRT